MDFDDLFGGDHHRRRDKRGHGHRDHDDRNDGHDHHDDDHGARYPYRPRDHEHDEDGYRSGRHDNNHHSGEFDLEHMAHRLFANKKLLVIAASVIVVVIVLAAIFLLPLLGQAVEFVDKSGVKGVIDRVWQDGGGGRK